jgi:hypothetical protein
MVEQVTDKKFYQITVTNHYKQALQLGQRIAAGKEHNPFFKFYETTLVYPITDGPTAQIVQVNAVDWLYRVKNKTIATSYEILADIPTAGDRSWIFNRLGATAQPSGRVRWVT